MASNGINFDPNMLGMAMALANTMMQFSGGRSSQVQRQENLLPAAAPETKKGRKSEKRVKEPSDQGVVVHQQQEAFPRCISVGIAYRNIAKKIRATSAMILTSLTVLGITT